MMTDAFNALSKDSSYEEVSSVLEVFYRTSQTGLSLGEIIFPIILHDSYVSILINGVEKDISIENFKRILDSCVGVNADDVSPIALPWGCFIFSKKSDRMQLNCYYPERRMDVTFEDNGKKTLHKFNIPFPNVIIYFDLRLIEDGSWKVINTLYFSTNKPVTAFSSNCFVKEKDTSNGVWGLPVCNMYGDGRMCYGKNIMPIRFTDNLRGLDYYYQVISNSPFNGDLGISSVTGVSTSLKWFEELSKLNSFPYERMKINT